MTLIEEMRDYIRTNRLSTTEIADAMGKVGFLKNVFSINPGLHAVGVIEHIVVSNRNNSSVHSVIANLEPGKVLLITVDSALEELAFLGDLMIKSAILYKQAVAVITNSKVRDAARLIKENYPVWSSGVSPIGAVNSPDFPILWGEFHGGLAIADDGGVVIIPNEFVTVEMMEKLYMIEDQEDLWSYCINTLKWSTHKTIVQKAYFRNSSEFPEYFKEIILKLEKGFPKLKHPLN